MPDLFTYIEHKYQIEVFFATLSLIKVFLGIKLWYINFPMKAFVNFTIISTVVYIYQVIWLLLTMMVKPDLMTGAFISNFTNSIV